MIKIQANETKLQHIIEGTKQYIVPLFQRGYSWDKNQWKILWDDLMELYKNESQRGHFIGSIVSMPTTSVPEGVTKYLLIDGQQRLTTIFIILVLLRNKAKESKNNEFADEINDTLLVNRYKNGSDKFKLLPTQIDRKSFEYLITSEKNINGSRIKDAYNYFEEQLNKIDYMPDRLLRIITNFLSAVSIVLDQNDNPYLVFESLNAKGRPLTQSDLIRNLIIMCIHIDQQEELYRKYWKPMEDKLQNDLTEFIRHYLMMDGSVVKQSDVYFTLKNKIITDNAISYMKELSKFANYYNKLLSPDNEEDLEIRKYLQKLKIIEVTTAYPLLLNIYNDFSEKRLEREDFLDILGTIENYLIRRFVCGIPSHQLNKIFPPIYKQISNNNSKELVEEFKSYLSTKKYPKDQEFREKFKEGRLYGSGERARKVKLILQALEESFNHKEEVLFDELTIEHIMPQTLSEWWQKYLGDEWEKTYELSLNCIGNLTLTGYNSELSNDDYFKKKEGLKNSHLELNKYFLEINEWNKENIEKRSDRLSSIALDIWPYFGDEEETGQELPNVTGTTPKRLCILGQDFEVKSWRDVMEEIMNTIADLEPEKFEIVIQNFPKYIGRDKNKFRAIRELRNGAYIETNLSAKRIQNICSRAMELIELPPEDWKIDTI